MTGSSIEVNFDATRAAATFRGLLKAATATRPMMRAIGVGLLENTQSRIEREESPDGSPFAPLLPAYALIKRGPGILRAAGMSGGLEGSLTMSETAASVTIGTNKVYGRIHQLGGVIKPVNARALAFFLGRPSAPGPRGGKRKPGKFLVLARSVTIPARPYLGFNAADEATAIEAIEQFLWRPATGA